MKLTGFYKDAKQAYNSSDKSQLPLLVDQPRSVDSNLIDVVGSYLGGGYQLGEPLGWSNDVFDLSTQISLDTKTDGVWIWPADASHYCRSYGILPTDADFIAWVVENKGRVPLVDQETLNAIEDEWDGVNQANPPRDLG
jgi:hypothetical protein